MLHALKRAWWRRRLSDPRYAFLFDDAPDHELVSLDCETTGLDVGKAEILSIGAIRIAGDTLLTSQRLDILVRPSGPVPEHLVTIHHLRGLDVAQGLPCDEAIRHVLDFVGPRPLVGYYIDFDAAMLDKHVRRLIGCPLPNRRVEVSRLYYDWRAPQLPPGANIDLRFETIRERLDLPRRAEHDAFNDALLAAMMYLRLRPSDPKSQTALDHSSKAK
ncbi:MAG TPA: 3'-5' exonuclease [Geminicoccaceae bacterium]|nr:3'-5' exonuclease [Geminicoccus sp.]HMU51687.1 3'-5' exonuclease [Geminicoccaceae bacterium]